MKLFNTPIIFIIFNRPAVTKRVFEVIRKMQPTRFFIAADGPRYPLKKEYELCEQTRAIVEQIDWPCDLQLLFNEQNMGCGKAVSRAITWFFQQVEEGIVLEDDCLPSEDFFFFCEELLAHYRHDSRVTTICGSTLLNKKYAHIPGHYLGNSNGVWGWATWRRAWALYDFEIKKINDPLVKERIRKTLGNDIVFPYVIDTFNLLLSGKFDTWDIQWYFAGLSNGGRAVCPFQNMISNIGHDGAHDQGKNRLHDRPVFPLDRSRITEPCSNADLVKEAELFHYKFHLIYPKNLFLWHIQQRAFCMYEKTVIALLGRRPVRLEGYISAVRWHLKRLGRKVIYRAAVFLRARGS